MQLEQRGYHDERDVHQDVADSLHDQVGNSAVVALDGSVDGSEDQVDHRDSHGEHQRESCTRGKACEDVLSERIGSEEEAGLEAVAVLEVCVLEHTALVGDRGRITGDDCVAVSLFRIRIVLSGVRLDSQGVVVAVVSVCLVCRNQLAVLERCNALGIGLVPDVGVGGVLKRNCRIDDLDSGFVLPGLDGLVLILREGHVDEAVGRVAVELHIVEGLAGFGNVGAVELADHVVAGFLLYCVVVGVVDIRNLDAFAAVPAQP